MAKRLRRIGQRHKLWAPSVAVLRLAARGMCTAHRFQNYESACRFGCGEGTDRMEHIFQCQVVVGALKSIACTTRLAPRLAPVVSSSLLPRDLLLLDGKEGSTASDTLPRRFR